MGSRELLSSTDRTQAPVSRLKFNAQQPIEMKLLRREPLLQLLAVCSVELNEHFSFLHVHEDAPRFYVVRAVKTHRERFRSLPRQARQRVLRNVSRHRSSCENLAVS